jgi:hypothetical protein
LHCPERPARRRTTATYKFFFRPESGQRAEKPISLPLNAGVSDCLASIAREFGFDEEAQISFLASGQILNQSTKFRDLTSEQTAGGIELFVRPSFVLRERTSTSDPA